MRACSLNFVFSMVVFLLIFTGTQGFFVGQGRNIVKSAYAQSDAEADEDEGGVDEGDPEAAALAESQLEAMNAQVRNIGQSLDQAERAHFGVILGNYNVYSLVKAVRNDVRQAVEACKKNNPEMEDRLDKRWEQWEKSVDANMKEALANINAMSFAQDYASQDKMQKLFSLVDTTRDANSSRFETIPVTTPEACEFMISKMDETEDNMNMLLITTIKSYPEIMKSMQE